MEYQWDQPGYQPPMEAALDPVIVPPESLQEETLRHLAVEFLCRESGQEYSESGVGEAAIARVLKALRTKTHFVTFDPNNETVGIIEAKNLPKHLHP